MDNNTEQQQQPMPPAPPAWTGTPAKAGWSTRRKVVVGIVAGVSLLAIGAGMGSAESAPAAAPATTTAPATEAPTTAPSEAPEPVEPEVTTPEVSHGTTKVCTIVDQALSRPAGSASRTDVLAGALWVDGTDLDLMDQVDKAYWSMGNKEQERLEVAASMCDGLGA